MTPIQVEGEPWFHCENCDLLEENDRLERILELNGMPVEDPTPVRVYLCPALAEMLGLAVWYPLPPKNAKERA